MNLVTSVLYVCPNGEAVGCFCLLACLGACLLFLLFSGEVGWVDAWRGEENGKEFLLRPVVFFSEAHAFRVHSSLVS